MRLCVRPPVLWPTGRRGRGGGAALAAALLLQRAPDLLRRAHRRALDDGRLRLLAKPLEQALGVGDGDLIWAGALGQTKCLLFAICSMRALVFGALARVWYPWKR